MSHQTETESPEQRDDEIIGTMFWRSIVVFSGMASIVAMGFGVWLMTRNKIQFPARSTDQKNAAVRTKIEVPDLPFTDITTAAGIKFTHTNGASGEKLLPETMGSGCAFFDYDSDGDADLLFVNSTAWPWDKPVSPAPTMALYRNDGTGKFEDATVGSGLDVTFYGMGVACGDYDADGWTDVFITAVGKNHLFRNVKGKFTETTTSAGVAGSDQEWSTSAAFFDCDNDGDLDLFVGNYVRWSREIDTQQGFMLDGLIRAYGPPMSFEGTYPYLYRNDGNGKFADISAASGVQVKNPVSGVPVAKTMGVMPVDIDSDGFLDLIVANDTVQNFVLMNQRNGTFEEMGIASGVGLDPATGSARGAMGIDAGYFRNDDCLGVAIGNFANEMTALYVSKPHEAVFLDEATASGMGPPTRQELTFGIVWIDCDLDGRLDLLAANGHLEQEINTVQPSQFYPQPPHLLWNAGPEQGSEFVSVPEEKVGAGFSKPLVGRGSAYADIDGDGDLDVIITASGGAPRLLRNDQKSKHHWLRVKLVGQDKSREALGAVVKITADKTSQSRVVMATRSYCSQSELPVTFGLGKEEKVDRLEIRWPDGTLQSVSVKDVDRLITVEQKTVEKK